MGNGQSNQQTVDKNFQMQKYLNQGLNQNQILQIKQAFDSYDPENGVISLVKYRECMEQSDNKDKISRQLGNKENMNFDQFFALEKQVLAAEIKKNPSIELDCQQVAPPTYFFCPYAQEIKKIEQK